MQHQAMGAVLASGLAVIGTFIQFYLSVQQLDAVERETFRVVDDWRTEVSWRHPIRRRRHRITLAEILAGNPDEAAAFKRVWRLIVSWTLLLVGAAIVFVQALRSLFAG